MKKFKVFYTIILFAAFMGAALLLEYLHPIAAFVFVGLIFFALAYFLVESSHRMAKEDLFISEVEQEISLQEQIRKVEKLIISAPTEDKEYLLEKSYKLRHQLYDLLLHRAQAA